MQKPLRFLAPLFLPALAVAQGSVHVVDAAGGAGSDFVSLSAAVSAAAPGDVLIVRAGSYAQAIELSAKPLTIVAEVGAAVQALKAEVSDTASDQPVLIRGLTLSTTDALSGSADHAQGPVWFEDTTFLGVPVPPGALSASGGVIVYSSASVVLSRCTLTRPFISSPLGALHAQNGSRLHVFDTSITSQPDQAAILLGSSFLDAAGSLVMGSNGANGLPFPFCTAQNGGDGLVLSGTSQVLVRGTVLSGGTGGAPCGLDGAPLIVNGGVVTTLPSPVGAYRIDALVRDDETVHATFQASPGDLAWLLFSPVPAPGIAVGVFDGQLLLDLATLDGFFVGVVPASGELALTAPAPALAPGQESAVLFTQALLSTPGGRLRMASPSALVVVDDAF